jgi:hypothetical protein
MKKPELVNLLVKLKILHLAAQKDQCCDFKTYFRRKNWRFCTNYCYFLLKCDRIVFEKTPFFRRKATKIAKIGGFAQTRFC